jgi:hypothetical protein
LRSRAAAIASCKRKSSGKEPVRKSSGEEKQALLAGVRKVNSQNPLLTVVVRVMLILAANLYAELNSGLTARAKENFFKGRVV